MTPAELAEVTRIAHDALIAPLEREIDSLRLENRRSREVILALKGAALRAGLPRRCRS